MLRTSLAFAAVLGFAIPAMAAPPSPDPKSLAVPQEELSKARELVQKLGSETFQEREEAERDLAAMGRLARAALLDAMNTDPDAEVRARCRTLLPKATAAEMKARLESFLADKDGKFEHDLPGWNKLRAVVRGEWQMLGWTFTTRPGSDKAARELFVEFLNTPGGRELLTAIGHSGKDLGSLVAGRKQELYNMRFGRVVGVPARAPSMMEVAVVLFADSQVSTKNAARNTVFQSVLTTSGVASAVLGTDDKSLALKSVLTAWFDSRTDPYDLYYALITANNAQNNDAAGRLAGRLMSTTGAPGSYKGQALSTLVRLKSLDQLHAIESAFTDTAAIATMFKMVNGVQVRQTVEVRDATLAAALLLTSQNPEDYGFEAFPKSVGGTFTYTQARIADEKRTAAFVKYGWWRLKESIKSSERK